MGAPAGARGRARDLRLDLFRGLANYAIFLDHIPGNSVAWLTTRNYGFSDAADIFVFIAGYLTCRTYGSAMIDRGFVRSAVLLCRRAWQLYVAHIISFVFYSTLIVLFAARFDWPELLDQYNVAWFAAQPISVLAEAIVLRFKPVNLDILPLYIVLMAGFAPMLWLMVRFANAAIGTSFAVYLLARYLDYNLPAYPSGSWYFNPFAWQFLFALGAWVAVNDTQQLRDMLRGRAVTLIAAIVLLTAFVVTVAREFETVGRLLPAGLLDALGPNDKTNLAPYRVAHLIAFAIVVTRMIPRDSRALRSPMLHPIVVSGQHSLAVFCLGIFLSLLGYFALGTRSDSIILQILVSAVGVGLMTGYAYLKSWTNSIVRG